MCSFKIRKILFQVGYGTKKNISYAEAKAIIQQVYTEAETKWPTFSMKKFKCIFLNENVWISIKFSLKFVSMGSINNNLALVQIMTWRRLGDKPLSEPMMAWPTDAYMHHSASVSEMWEYSSLYCYRNTSKINS